jgi:CheY-like chemotaxis protein
MSLPVKQNPHLYRDYSETNLVFTEVGGSTSMANDLEPSQEVSYEAAKIILIVEDDEDIGYFLVQALLQETPYHPIYVTDGYAALKIIHGLKPDLLILDYQLPHMNGIEVYDQLRAIQGLEDIPAILMTAGTGMPRSQVEKRKLVGISKPLELSQFLEMIETLLG